MHDIARKKLTIDANPAVLNGKDRSLRTIIERELAQDESHVILDRLGANSQQPGNLFSPGAQRLRGIGVMLYVLRLSYGGVEDALLALALAGSKTGVYCDVQAAGEAVKRVRQAQTERKVAVMGADTTFVTCNRE